MNLINKIFKGNTLYYPGCATKFAAPFLIEKYEKILKGIGIDYIKLNDLELCCGSPALNAGYGKDFYDLAKKNLQIFKDHSVKKIITNCPACFKVFKNDYKEILGDEWNIEVQHIVVTLIEQLKNKKINLKNQNITVTYHDPCHLGKQSKIFDEPREVLAKAGVKIKEMKFSKDKSFCCGGGGGVKSNNKEAANKIAAERLAMANETGMNILITPCPMCYLNLKENSQQMEIKEFAEMIEVD